MPPPKLFDVFLSHSSEDKDKVRVLVQRLRNEEVSVWIDEDEIYPGENIIGKLQRGLVASRYIVLALSNAAIKSKWVELEYQSILAIEVVQSSTRLIPVLLEPIDIKDLPPFLLIKHCVDLNKSGAFDRLVAKIKRPTVSEYCEQVQRKPLMSGRLFNGNYHIEPADLLRVVLREIEFRSADPIRPIQMNESLTLSDFVGELTDGTLSGPMHATVLFGEAGVGKTTTCKWLCQQMAEGWSSQRVVPVYVPLGEIDPDGDFQTILDRQIDGETFNELAHDVQYEDGKLLLFLDGLNELAPDMLERVLVWSHKVASSRQAMLVLTSRPVVDAKTIWPAEDIRFFEIQRWTEQQLERYFEKNRRSSLLRRVPAEVRHSLRLPLLAFLILRRLDWDEPVPSLHTVSDVFAYILDQFLATDVEAQKSQIISGDYDTLRSRYKIALQKLAYLMTQKRVVQTEGELFESILDEHEKELFRPLLAHLVNSGLLRCTNTTVAIDPAASLKELRRLKISFLHQALQEYLTAQWLLSPYAVQLPQDVSHDAFWRDVPIYMIKSFGSAKQQGDFALKFLAGEPDYLTSARLAAEISDIGSQKFVQNEVIKGLLENISAQGLYPYAIEAFDALGNPGIEALRSCLTDQAALTNVFAKFEAHLIRRSIKKSDEIAWRPLGRSVYLLGELADFWLAEHLNKQLPSICSLHLLYHIGEALLTLARKSDDQEGKRRNILSAAKTLFALPQGDPVTRAYAWATLRACNSDQKDQRTLEVELQRLLSNRATIKRRHFQDEFWQRAHGAEAFAELATPVKCVEVLSHLFTVENTADYSGHEEVGYRQVQSSILKAALRSCDLSNGEDADWRPFLESVFASPRIAENGWACRHLERLLLARFRDTKNLTWIKQWKDSESVGGQKIRDVLANVVWLSN